MFLSRLTWPEVDALDREIPIVVPMSGLVQGGRHLAIGAALAVVEAVVSQVAEERPNALFLPVLPLGVSERHQMFPGTIAHSFEAVDELLRGTVESLLRHGFRRFLFLVGDKDSLEPVRLAARRLKASHPTLRMAVFGFDEFAASNEYAGQIPTSRALYLDESLVRMEFAEFSDLHDPLTGAVNSQDERSEYGSQGSPHRADHEGGGESVRSRIGMVRERIDMLASDEPIVTLRERVESTESPRLTRITFNDLKG